MATTSNQDDGLITTGGVIKGVITGGTFTNNGITPNTAAGVLAWVNRVLVTGAVSLFVGPKLKLGMHKKGNGILNKAAKSLVNSTKTGIKATAAKL